MVNPYWSRHVTVVCLSVMHQGNNVLRSSLQISQFTISYRRSSFPRMLSSGKELIVSVKANICYRNGSPQVVYLIGKANTCILV